MSFLEDTHRGNVFPFLDSAMYFNRGKTVFAVMLGIILLLFGWMSDALFNFLALFAWLGIVRSEDDHEELHLAQWPT